MNTSYADLTPKQQEVFSTIAKSNLHEAGMKAAGSRIFTQNITWKSFNKRTIKSLLKYGLISFPGEHVYLTNDGIDLALRIGINDHIVAYNNFQELNARNTAKFLFKEEWKTRMLQVAQRAITNIEFRHDLDIHVDVQEKYGSMSDSWELTIKIDGQKVNQDSNRPFGLFEVIMNKETKYMKTCSGDHVGLDASIFAEAAVKASELINSIWIHDDLKAVASQYTEEAKNEFVESMI